jgi:transcription antitermination factor NusG
MHIRFAVGSGLAAEDEAAFDFRERDPRQGSTEERIGGAVGQWWVLHTRARCEKAVAAALEEQSITHYLPLVRAKWSCGRRVICGSKPLFPGYLFMCGSTPQYYAAYRTHRVANILQVADQNRFRNELRQICRVVESGESVSHYSSLREGRRCRITAGSLKGIEGVVLRRCGRTRMYISATVLGQSAVIDVDSAMLEAVD